MNKGTFDMTHDELGKITRSMRSSTFREELGSYVDERSDPKHRDEEDVFWEESARNGSIPAGNVVIKPQPGFVARTKLRLTNGAYMNFYMNICFSPVLKDVEMETVAGGQSIKMPQVFSEARIEREDGETGSTCQVCVSVVSMKTLMMAEVMSELKELIVDQTIAVMKKNFVSEGENLSPDYELIPAQQMKCKGARPRFCLAPFDYLVPNYKKCSAKDIVFQGQAGGNSDVITPGQIESLKRRHEQDQAAAKAAAGSTDEDAGEEVAAEVQPTQPKAKRGTNIVVGRSYTFVEPSAAAGEGEKGCELQVVEGSRISTSATMSGEGEAAQTLPSHLTVRVRLPGVSSAAGIDVDVGEEGRLLTLKVPGKYCVEKRLPFAVDFAAAGAKFVRQASELEITLPVVA